MCVCVRSCQPIIPGRNIHTSVAVSVCVLGSQWMQRCKTAVALDVWVPSLALVAGAPGEVGGDGVAVSIQAIIAVGHVATVVLPALMLQH